LVSQKSLNGICATVTTPNKGVDYSTYPMANP
jgi:hypothetical protein